MATDTQIRAQIKAVILSAQPNAIVYPFNALTHDLSEYPGLFRAANGKTHGWIIKRAEIKGEWKNLGRKDKRSFRYDVWGFYKFEPDGTETANTDDEFAVITDSIYEAFKAAPRLNFDTVVEAHELLQYAAITTINCGEETLHFAQGRLIVQLCC